MKLVIPGRLSGLNKLIGANRSGWQAGASIKKKNQKMVLDALTEQLPDFKTERPISLHIDWYEPNKRRDPDNIYSGVKYILDGLVEYGTIPNDNQNYIVGISNRHFIDKDNPRVEIEIKEQ